MAIRKADFSTTPRNKARRLPERAAYDKETIYAIVDEAPICHVGFVQDGQPYVIPIIHARQGDTLYIHGAKASRLIKHIAAGEPVCVEATLLDGLVFARSLFHHSMNYRSAVLFGRGRLVESDAEKLSALEAISDHLAPGRWEEARQPNRKELNATSLAAIQIESASAKTRSGPPSDDEDDYELPVWAGVLPLRLRALEPQPDSRLPDGVPLSESISRIAGA